LHGGGRLSGPEGVGGGGVGLWVSGFDGVSAARRQTIDRSDPRQSPPQIFLSLDGMAFRPADSRENVPVASKRLRNKVEQARWEFPFVVEGPLTATTFNGEQGREVQMDSCTAS